MALRACNLVIMDAGPLIKLAAADHLNLLLNFHRNIFIPDEVYFEAVEKLAWENNTPLTQDKIRLKDWIAKQQTSGRVSLADTYIGDNAKRDRASGRFNPTNYPKGLGESASTSFFYNRDAYGFRNEPALMLIDDRPAIELMKIQALDMFILTTYAMLIALEEEHIIQSADTVWDDITHLLPTVDKVIDPDPSGSVRGDSEYGSIMKR